MTTTTLKAKISYTHAHNQYIKQDRLYNHGWSKVLAKETEGGGKTAEMSAHSIQCCD